MKKLILIVSLFLAGSLFAEKIKEFKQNYPVDKRQKVRIEGLSGGSFDIVAWDKDEVAFELALSVKSNKKKIEKEYFDEFKIKTEMVGNERVIIFDEPSVSPDYSFWDIITLSLNFSFSSDLKGKIYLPARSTTLRIAYSDINMHGFNSPLRIIGKSNKIWFEQINGIEEISNDYGEFNIRNSAGNLKLENKSGKVNIIDFTGNVTLDAKYAEIKLGRIKGNCILKSQSAGITIDGIEGDLSVESKYSNLQIRAITGKVDVENQSGDISISEAGPFTIDAPYSTISVTGAGSEKIGNKITSKSGKLRFRDTKGALMIRDGYSGISFSETSGDINLSTTSGTIDGDRINGNFIADIKYSTLEIERLTADEINIVNQSGKILIKALKEPQKTLIKNRYADIFYYLPDELKGDYKLYSTYGKIVTDFGFDTKVLGESTAISTFSGIKRDITAEIEALNGNVYLRKF